MRRLSRDYLQELRRTRRRTVLLFITDRCPVGCGHCSVDSRPDSPRITDFELFGEILAGIAGDPRIEVVGISGGEPFVERRGLPLAVGTFRRAGQDVVIYTSGFWASGSRCPGWIRGVLSQTSTVFLSTDSFHRSSVGRDRFRRAVGFIAAEGCHLVVQALDEPGVVDFVGDVVAAELGDAAAAEINVITPLRTGRGADVFQIGRRRGLDEFGTCGVTASPSIRYDGRISGCCNEAVLMGAGPAALRRAVRDRDELRAALTYFWDQAPLLRALSAFPAGALAQLPGMSGLADERYESICGACWKAHDIAAGDPRTGRLLAALGAVAEQVSR